MKIIEHGPDGVSLVEEFGRTYAMEAGFLYRTLRGGELIYESEIVASCIDRNDDTGEERSFLIAVVGDAPQMARRLLEHWNKQAAERGHRHSYRLRDGT